MATPKDHIEEIRSTKFSIGGKPNPLIEDLHQAVKNLSAELYAKDVHFLMELIQNAEDNEYPEGVKPSLEFVITSRDITGTGAASTLLVFNNERGFSSKNIESICSVGRSTKKGNRKRGYIGEKGIGFKSVFLITAQPYIFSKGYQLRFNEGPCAHCGLGYIVPEWVDASPTLSTIKQIYGSGATLPTTTIVLPLKSDKVKPVKEQLSSLHPEILLFLSKIKRLSVREDNENPKLNTVTAIQISKEVNFTTRKNIDAESFMLHLSADENGNNEDTECGYHMWRQRFPVKSENKVEKRKEVDEFVITLAFPTGERLNRGKNSPGIYAYLPTEMFTNFPFIIQADFLLASSREMILLDDIWNKGILDCVPVAFIEAFTSLVKSVQNAPISSLPPMFQYLPVSSSSYKELNVVRDSIKAKLLNESIVPCESYMEQKFFQKPSEVGRLMNEFWNILSKARQQGLTFSNISSHGKHIICSSFDTEGYNLILSFLGVEYVDHDWYAKCIQSSGLVRGVSEDLYLELLHFIYDKLKSSASILSIPILKYVDRYGNLSLCTISGKTLFLSQEKSYISWLINWNKEFQCVGDRFFLPKPTQDAICSFSKRHDLIKWLFESVSAGSYARLLLKSLNNDRKLVLTFVHFLYHSLSKSYLSKEDVSSICNDMPLVDTYGKAVTRRNGVLVPASGSKWINLVGSNPWRDEGYVELGEDYLRSGNYAGIVTRQKELLDFLRTHLKAYDIPYLSAPNAEIPSLYAPLTKENALLLLEWLRNLRIRSSQLPKRFLTSLQAGSWLKISLNGSSGYRSPSQSFLLSSTRGRLLQHEAVLVDIPLVDENFYGSSTISQYKEELKTCGVMFEHGEACEYIGKHLMSLAASSTLSRANVISILKFIKYLRGNSLPPTSFVDSIKNERWLRTSLGDRAPCDSVLFNNEWKAASQISDIPFIDQGYYGQEICNFKDELELMGVAVGFSQKYKFVVDNIRTSTRLVSLSPEALILVLSCIRYDSSTSNKLVKYLKDTKCVKTSSGYRPPTECFLCSPEWGCLLKVFNSFPVVDEAFYGPTILAYKAELKTLGLVVEFEEAAKSFSQIFKQQASLSSIKKDNVISLLSCYRKLSTTSLEFPAELKKTIGETKWLRTRLGDYRTPKECVLFCPDWKAISQICVLPFIDDTGNCYGNEIHEYEKVLVTIGVVADFKKGAKFIVDSVYLPQDLSTITPQSVYSLLDSMRELLKKPGLTFPEESFLKRIEKRWLKTHAGYRAADECMMFTSDSDWKKFLKPGDGPFIDEEFYGKNIESYKKELCSIGVTADATRGCLLLLKHLDFHSNIDTIKRIYSYVSQNSVELSDTVPKKIWIPNGSDDGEWVNPEECVLHDRSDLFGLQLNILDKHYDQKVLHFFSGTFGVKAYPSFNDYCNLWKIWEKSGHILTQKECSAFWECVAKHWGQMTEKTLAENLVKLPVYSSGSDEILLCDKNDVFIGDDLYLKELFEKSTSRPIFVWSPLQNIPSLPRSKLLEIYGKIGVKTLSESVQKELSTVDIAGQKQVDPNEAFVKRGLCKLVLGFLASNSVKMEAEKRHEAVKRLTDLTFFETLEPITVEYSLPLSDGKEVLNVKASRMIRWDTPVSKFFTQKVDMSGGRKSVIEHASHFAEVVAEGVLWKVEDYMEQLSELIMLGFLVEFDDEAVDYLMKLKNLQIFLEDEEFISSVFPA